MRVALSALSFLVAGVAIWAFFFRSPAPSADQLTDMIMAGNPEVSAEGIAWNGCRLSLSGAREDEANGLLLQARLQVDLQLFELAQVRILPADGGAATYIASHRDGADYVGEAVRLAALLPETLRGDGDWSEVALSDLLGTRGGELSFRMASMASMAEGGEAPMFTPHEDAPTFYRFAEAALAQEPPLTVRVAQMFQGGTAREDSFLSGEVALPGALQFRFETQGAAEAFGEALYAYQQAHCPG